jgi:tetratricopeptide (TPR) repeat protein
MNQPAEKVLSYLTGSEDIEAVTAEDLQKLVAEHPYFPVTQFLLTKKLKSENDERYLSQAQKAILYFSNPYWLNYLLSKEQSDEEITDEEPPTISIEDEQKDVSKVADSSLEEHGGTLTSSPVDRTNDEKASNYTGKILPKIPSQEETETKDRESLEVNHDASDSETIELSNIVQVEEESAAITRTTNAESENFINDLDANTPSTEAVDQNQLNVPLAADIEVTELEEEMAGVTRTTDDATKNFLEETENQFQKDELPVDDEHDRMFQNIKAMLDASSEEASADTKDAVIPLDPYYTIDYFASQGIKLELDQNPQDQLGQNLKKFTQWLKHMKKLGPEDATEAINRTESDADVQQIADSSNTVREVVTEAMALVLEKQGKTDKAIELYNKLSFLNPDKRVYFADKIKKLKGT